MTMKQLEERLIRLEHQMNVLTNKPAQGWRALIGLSTDDPIMKKAMKLALQSRKEDRLKAKLGSKRKGKK
jgi:hypothetical protein